MRARWIGIGAAAAVALGLAGFGVWVGTLPPDATTAAAPPVPAQEYQSIVQALRPPAGRRPVVAVIGINDATETTDYLMPVGILRRADVADVVMVATGPGPVQLYPALAVEPDMTIAAFDAAHPDGADYVIVPAMSRDDDPAAADWIRAQAASGARIIGICAGAKVLAAAGLLDGRRATTHWFYLSQLRKLAPTARYVPDRRIVVDGPVATTTGISASMPMMLTLIEAIAGRTRAEEVAQGLGLPDWDIAHASAAFRLTRPFATTVLGNRMAVWDRREIGLPVEQGIDEVALALVADAWSRTYRSRAVTLAGAPGAVRTLGGVRLRPDRVAAGEGGAQGAAEALALPPAAALDRTLAAIAGSLGAPTARIVAMQLEYPVAPERLASRADRPSFTAVALTPAHRADAPTTAPEDRQ